MSATTTEPVLLIERRGPVLVLRVNRPDKRNAINFAVKQALTSALDQAAADDRVRCIVLTGAGEQSFCAGADLKAISRGEDIFPAENRHWGFAGMMQHYVSVPVIAAVNGTALGGGCEIALASDLVVAADHAIFGLPEVKRGLVAAAGGAFRLPEQLPHRVAMEMMLTGEPISAERALELHLINRVVPADQLLDAALELAEVIAANAPLAVQGSKRVALGIIDGTRPGEVEKWRVSDTEMINVMTSEDAAEGPRAFAEKRAPVWKAR